MGWYIGLAERLSSHSFPAVAPKRRKSLAHLARGCKSQVHFNLETTMTKDTKFEDMGLAKTVKPPADPDIKNGNSNSLKAAMKALEKMK